MATPPLVSVCMTTYNHEAYLAQAIESVLAQQTSFGVELVLGDDCSTDSTAAICREYAAKYPGRVRFVTGQRNVGWRANYRRTFEACRGKYVAYCDGDDWWSDPRKLQMQADLLESDPSCGMCYTRASNYYQNTGLTEPDHEEHFTDFDHLLCRLTIANCATLARRDLIARYYAEVRPDEHPEWLTDDAPMWLWFAACSRVRYLPAITAVHRRLPQSVSHSTEYPRRIAFCDSLMDISCGSMPVTVHAATGSASCGGAVRSRCGYSPGTVPSANTSPGGAATWLPVRACCSAPKAAGSS